jgi:hypothetical protein
MTNEEKNSFLKFVGYLTLKEQWELMEVI